MIWDETKYKSGCVEYNECKICCKYPAIALHSERICGEFAGPFCRQHWLDEINKVFGNLDRRLENEDWGSSPETRREI